LFSSATDATIQEIRCLVVFNLKGARD